MSDLKVGIFDMADVIDQCPRGFEYAVKLAREINDSTGDDVDIMEYDKDEGYRLLRARTSWGQCLYVAAWRQAAKEAGNR